MRPGCGVVTFVLEKFVNPPPLCDECQILMVLGLLMRTFSGIFRAFRIRCIDMMIESEVATHTARGVSTCSEFNIL